MISKSRVCSQNNEVVIFCDGSTYEVTHRTKVPTSSQLRGLEVSELVGDSSLMPSFRRAKRCYDSINGQVKVYKAQNINADVTDTCGFSVKQAGGICREKEDAKSFLIYKRAIIQGKDPK